MSLENIVIICVIIYVGFAVLETFVSVVLETLIFLAEVVLDLVSDLIDHIKERSKKEVNHD